MKAATNVPNAPPFVAPHAKRKAKKKAKTQYAMTRWQTPGQQGNSGRRPVKPDAIPAPPWSYAKASKLTSKKHQ